jgi:putative RNA methylase family UPF0020
VNITLKKFPYRYLPYEKRLLLEEARSLGGEVSEKCDLVEVRAALTLARAESVIARLHKLTYFSHFGIGQGPLLPTQQFLLETTANGNGTAARQSTRYSAHGLHEYKGKFHPQIARYLMSQCGLSEKSTVLDPFAGSGTVLVEAIHFGCNALGVEANPLAVLVANSKIRLLSCAAREIKSFSRVVERVADGLGGRTSVDRSAAELGLTEGHLKYLQSWFAPKILAALLAFRAECRRLLAPEWSQVADALAGSIARDVSHQDPADLRIRRRKEPLTEAPVAVSLATSLKTLMTRTVAARNLIVHSPVQAKVFLGDSRRLPPAMFTRLPTAGSPTFGAIITSPPYANALPYVDTSRLSLILLGLCSPSELRPLEKLQIGNREISPTDRKRIEGAIGDNLEGLPRSIGRFVNMLLSSLKTSPAGFRKRNTPALLVEYFGDMKAVLVETRKVLANSGVAFWLVGPNRTQLNAKWLEIDTPHWIAEIAESVGYSANLSPLDTYQRFGLHQRNSIHREFLVELRRI